MAIAPVHLPSLGGATGWLNSGPLSAEDLRGSVVLVNFWTLTCINWLRQAPYVRAWSRAYRDDGLVVLGVHTPEFAFEHDPALVRHAVGERSIDYPVALDGDYGVWTAFANHFWPALYFADRDGVLRDEHFGEGRYEESERRLQELLGIERPLVHVEGSGDEAEADWAQLRTAETYLGYQRGSGFASPHGAAFDAPMTYELPAVLRLNEWALQGAWAIEGERAVTQEAGARVAFRFHARDAHLVLARSTAGPVPFRVRLDGAAPGDAHGTHVEADGDGLLGHGAMYHLVRQPGGVAERTVEIEFLAPGAEAYAFTFG